MKAAVLMSPLKLEVKEVEKPEISKNEVLIKVKACGICTTDRRWYSGVSKIPYPAIMGHEISGVVESVGTEDAELSVGSPITAGGIFSYSCGHCIYCKKGFENQCINFRQRYLNSGELLCFGGFSEYAVFPIRGVFRVNDKITLEEATLAEPLSCVIHSFKKANVSFGDTVVVLGAGPMGLLHLMLAKLNGCKVAVSDPDDERLELAENIGADVRINPSDKNFYQKIDDFAKGGTVDKIFVTAGNEEAVKQALKIGKKLSTIVLFASLHSSAPIEVSPEIHYSENVLTGSRSQTAKDFLDAVKLLSSRVVDIRPLISRVVSLNDIEDGFNVAPKGKIQRVLVKP